MRSTVSGAIGVISLLLASGIGAWQVRAFLAVDACLDDGGSFDYLVGICDFAANHPAHPAINLAALGLSLLWFCFGIFVLRRGRAHAI
jgi:hypothetical protein